MSRIIGKRQLILAFLVVALGAAVFINWYYTKPDAIDGAESEEDVTVAAEATSGRLGDAQFVDSQGSKSIKEYFATVKLNRDAAHDEAIATIKNMVTSVESVEMVSAANKSLESFSKSIKQEADIEALVTAKTGSECVAVINEDKIDVVVDNKVLSDNVILQIKDIVLGNSGIKSDNITIIGAK